MKETDNFDAVATTRKLLCEATSVALATVMPQSGAPFASLITLATEPDGSPICLLSDLAVHCANLRAEPRASIMIEERDCDDPLQGARISLSGILTATDDPAARACFLDRYPDARSYCDFTDFKFYRLALETVHLVAGFGRIVDLPANMVLQSPNPAME